MSQFADLILPLPLQNTYTYQVPKHMEGCIAIGCRVLVQFGKKKFYTGLVVDVHDKKPDYDTKEIVDLVDATPVVRPSQTALWEWMSDYYIATMGEVMKAAMPSGLKMESETHVAALDNVDPEVEDALTDRQREALAVVREKKKCTIADIAQALGIGNAMTHVKALIDAETIAVAEEMKDSYKPRVVTAWRLTREMRNEDAMLELMPELERKAPRQAESLMAFMQAAGGLGLAQQGKWLTRDKVTGRLSTQAMAELVKKGILEQQRVAVSRLTDMGNGTEPPHELTSAQNEALEQIKEGTAEGKPVLLYGVTGSGKTEIYIHLIHETLERGDSALYLLPEIALTTQMTERLRRHFGDRMVVYHSKFSDGERVEVWQKLLHSTEPTLVLCVRSGVLLPLPELGLIVVDEEHESSYKQQDPAPRYNARDMAVLLAMQMSARRTKEGETKTDIVLGSATPSLESWVNAMTNKYKLVKLTERHSGVMLPEVQAIDMTEARKHKETESMFSLRLKEVVSNALQHKEQVILFQNRRGFAPVVECAQCAWVPKCINCDVSLTLHKATGQLVCHYCGHFVAIPTTCPACGTPSLRPQGFGTEKIEESCNELFPNAKVVRMDLDTARSRQAFEQIISDFAARKQDILIGTQMVSKGLDFDGVTTVGIMNADSLLNMPDFRADERAFQLMAQVSGRAGRRSERGKVFVQISKADHPVVADVAAQDYESNANRLLKEREAYHFPPFFRLINLVVKHKIEQACNDAAKIIAYDLTTIFGNLVSGPISPLVGRVATFYLQEISIKMPRSANPRDVKTKMMDVVNRTLAESRFKGTIVKIDVDPY